jgi:predicted PurR-regulated permease PerM
MVGGAVGGIVGIYLSIPLVATLRVLWRRFPELKNAEVSRILLNIVRPTTVS